MKKYDTENNNGKFPKKIRKQYYTFKFLFFASRTETFSLPCTVDILFWLQLSHRNTKLWYLNAIQRY